MLVYFPTSAILRYLIEKIVKSSETNDFEVLVGISVFGSHELCTVYVCLWH